MLTKDQKLFVGVKWADVVYETEFHSKLMWERNIKFVEGLYGGMPAIGAIKLTAPDGRYKRMIIVKVVEKSDTLYSCFTAPIYVLHPLIREDFNHFNGPKINDYIINHAD